jgi:hypothetical protein
MIASAWISLASTASPATSCSSPALWVLYCWASNHHVGLDGSATHGHRVLPCVVIEHSSRDTQAGPVIIHLRLPHPTARPCQALQALTICFAGFTLGKMLWGVMALATPGKGGLKSVANALLIVNTLLQGWCWAWVMLAGSWLGTH